MSVLWKNLSAAPHRVMFLPGVAQVILAMAWWWLLLEGRTQGWTGPLEILAPTGAAHGWLMVYGMLPFFVFGFLFTALPNWVDGPPVPRREYLPAAGLLAAGSLLFYPGLYLPGLLPLALVLHLAGWTAALMALARVLFASPPGDRRQPWLTWLTLAAGLLGDLAWLVGSLTGSAEWPRLGNIIGLWGLHVPLFLAVCHRMLPWFTSRVVQDYTLVRPHAVLLILLAACYVHAGLEILGRPELTWPADFTLAILSFWLAATWHAREGMKVRLLAMLHLAFPWAGVGFTLYGLDSLSAFLGQPLGLGHAPLHALGIGFCGGMLVAMASRVSLGHSGRRLEADNLTWGVFWGVQMVAVLRLLPDMVAALPYGLVAWAALAWLAVFAPWVWRYAPIYWRPRADGRPG